MSSKLDGVEMKPFGGREKAHVTLLYLFANKG